MGRLKKKAGTRSSRLAKPSKRRENTDQNTLPSQDDGEIVLFKTEPSTINDLPNAIDYRNGLAQFKQKFLWETQEWSKKFGLKVDVRVFFTFKPEA